MKNLLSRFERLPLSRKFFFVFSMIGGSAVIVALSVGFSLYTISRYNAASDHAVRKVQLITAVQFNTSLVWQYMTDASLTKSQTVIAQEAAPVRKKAQEDLATLLALPDLTENERRDFNDVNTRISAMFDLGVRMARAYAADKRSGDLLMKQFDMQMTAVLSRLKENVTYENAELQSILNGREQLLWGVIIAVGCTSLLLIGMTVFLSRWLTNYILTPIRKITELSQRVAEGEFVYRITGITEKDELGTTCWEFNDMVDQIEALMKEIITSIEYAGQGKYFRKPLSVGLRGLLGRAAVQVERSLKEQELRMRSIEEDKKYLSLKTNEMLYAMEKFAEGDLTVMVQAEKEDEIKKLFDGFNRSIANLNRRLLEVNEAAERASEAGSTISSSTTQMAAGAEEQSAQTGEVASAMEEMSKTISENAHSAQLAVQTAIQARHAAQNGGTLVENTVNGMERITEVVKHSAVTINALGKSSSQIGEIVGVINDIADQTNLLALNAAIEAARAGEQGRGFAVVADEVRKLAERTTKATKEISVMIRRIQEDTKEAVAGIEEGTKNVEEERQLAAKAGASLKEIVSIVNTVTEMISTIATANAEQAKAGEDISRNIVGISAVTNENTHAIDQISRSAEQVAQITANLQGLVGSFTLDLSKDPAHRSDVVVQPNGTLTKKKTVARAAHQSV